MVRISGNTRSVRSAVAGVRAARKGRAAMLAGKGGVSGSIAEGMMAGSRAMAAAVGRWSSGLFGTAKGAMSAGGFGGGTGGDFGGGVGDGEGRSLVESVMNGQPDHLAALLNRPPIPHPEFEEAKEAKELEAPKASPASQVSFDDNNSKKKEKGITKEMVDEAVLGLQSEGYGKDDAKKVVEKIKDKAKKEVDKFETMIGDLPTKDDNWHRNFAEWYVRWMKGGDATKAQKFALDEVGGGTQELKLKWKSGKKNLTYEITSEPSAITGLSKGNEIQYKASDASWYGPGGSALDIEGSSGAPTKDIKRFDIEIKVEKKPDVQSARTVTDFMSYIDRTYRP